MKYVRWKRYGFTHVIADKPKQTRWGGVATVCGNDATHYNGFRISWLSLAEKKAGLKKGDLDPKLLAPSDKDDGKRPLCGACAKYVEKQAANG